MNNQNNSSQFRTRFTNNGAVLSAQGIITVVTPSEEWTIADGGRTHTLTAVDTDEDTVHDAIEVVAEMYLAGIITHDGVIDGELAEKSDRIVANGRTWSYILWRGTQELTITQTDIRAIQLAKAALYAGIRLLMDKMNIENIDQIRLAVLNLIGTGRMVN